MTDWDSNSPAAEHVEFQVYDCDLNPGCMVMV